MIIYGSRMYGKQAEVITHGYCRGCDRTTEQSNTKATTVESSDTSTSSRCSPAESHRGLFRNATVAALAVTFPKQTCRASVRDW